MNFDTINGIQGKLTTTWSWWHEWTLPHGSICIQKIYTWMKNNFILYKNINEIDSMDDESYLLDENEYIMGYEIDQFLKFHDTYVKFIFMWWHCSSQVKVLICIV